MTDIKLGDLASRVIRESQVPGGIRRFAFNQYKEKKDEKGGLLGLILDVGGKFFGFVSKAIFGAASWSLTSLWNWICNGVQFIWSFDWNQSDESMDASLKTAWDGFGGILGGAFGNALGWLLPGLIAGQAMFQLNVPLAVYVLNEYGEEAMQEIAGNAAAVLRAGSNLLGKAIFNWGFQAIRGAIMGRESDIYLSDEQIAQQVKDGTMTEAVGKKNKEGRDALKSANKRKPWSFALKWEEWREENLPEGFWQNFYEEFFEEFFEAIREAGSEICMSIEGFYADMVRASDQSLIESLRSHVAQVELNRSSSPAPA